MLTGKGRWAWLSTVLALTAPAADAPAWPDELPALKLLDPTGVSYDEVALKERGAVVIVSTPTPSQGDAQRTWDAMLAPLAGKQEGPTIVIVQDLEQSWMKPVVLAHIKSVYRTGGIVLLLDDAGALRKALGVGRDTTVAFAFAPGGKRAAVETGKGTIELAQKLVKAARGVR